MFKNCTQNLTFICAKCKLNKYVTNMDTLKTLHSRSHAEVFCRWLHQTDTYYSYSCSTNTHIMLLTHSWGPSTLHFYGLSSVMKNARIQKPDRSHLALYLLTAWLWDFLNMPVFPSKNVSHNTYHSHKETYKNKKKGIHVKY